MRVKASGISGELAQQFPRLPRRFRIRAVLERAAATRADATESANVVDGSLRKHRSGYPARIGQRLTGDRHERLDLAPDVGGAQRDRLPGNSELGGRARGDLAFVVGHLSTAHGVGGQRPVRIEA